VKHQQIFIRAHTKTRGIFNWVCCQQVLASSFSGTIYTEERSTNDHKQLSYHQGLHMELPYTAQSKDRKKAVNNKSGTAKEVVRKLRTSNSA